MTPDRRKASAPRERTLLPERRITEHGEGFIAYGLQLPLNEAASEDCKAGYREARDNVISILTAQP